eukprot:2716242-Amphidinium_carterae.1
MLQMTWEFQLSQDSVGCAISDYINNYCYNAPGGFPPQSRQFHESPFYMLVIQATLHNFESWRT